MRLGGHDALRERPGALLDSKTCRVWTTTCAGAPPEEDLLADLDATETARAARFHHPADRRRFVTGRAGLRRVLARSLCRDAASLRFSYGALGKPALVREPGSPDVRFNVSHAGDLVVWALAVGDDVGVDVEQVNPGPVDPDLVRAALSMGERARLVTMDEADAADGFATCWTAKEAYAKALGLGLAVDFRSLDVLPSLERGGRVTVPATETGASVVVRTLPAPPGYRLALASVASAAGCTVTVEPFRWDGDPYAGDPRTGGAPQ